MFGTPPGASPAVTRLISISKMEPWRLLFAAATTTLTPNNLSNKDSPWIQQDTPRRGANCARRQTLIGRNGPHAQSATAAHAAEVTSRNEHSRLWGGL